jgi:hypothetical protein
LVPRKAIERFIPIHSSPIVKVDNVIAVQPTDYGEKMENIRRDFHYLNRDVNRTNSHLDKFITRHEAILEEPNFNNFLNTESRLKT